MEAPTSYSPRLQSAAAHPLTELLPSAPGATADEHLGHRLDPAAGRSAAGAAPEDGTMSIYQAVRSRIGTGRKRRFGIAGLINLVVSNGFLQALLAANTPVAISTLATQILNGLFGYLTYGKYAFRASIRDPRSAARYSALAGLLWIENWSGIRALHSLGTPKSLGAIVMILPLAAMSYIVQRKWVFRKP